MKRISASEENSSFWPGALLAEGRIWAENGLDGSVWVVRAGKRNPSSKRDQPDGFLGAQTGRSNNRPVQPGMVGG